MDTEKAVSGGEDLGLGNAGGELLVRMGFIRARLDGGAGRRRRGGAEVAGEETPAAAADRKLRPVAESLWREVEELRHECKA